MIKNIYSIQLIQGTLCFSGQAQVAQKSEWWKIFQYSETFQGELSFSGQAQVAQKPWMIKNISIQWAISGQLLFFRARVSCSKILNDKKCIFNTVTSGHSLFFRASASCSKTLNDKKIFQFREKFEGNSCFSGQAQLAQKYWMMKRCVFNTVNSGHTLFFRASASCSNIVNVKVYSIGPTVKNFWANSVFQDKRKLLKNPEW